MLKILYTELINVSAL